MIWYLYVVRCRDDSLYTGITVDVERRVHEHNTSRRGAKYTRSKRPVTLIYSEALSDRSSAQKRENSFKRLSRNDKIIFLRERGVELC